MMLPRGSSPSPSQDADPADGSMKWSSTLRMTVECLGRSTPTLTWSLLALHGGDTVVSGDSLGHVQFWNGKTGTLISSCNQNDSHADVLCLATTRDESRVFASGVDSRVVCIEKQLHKNNWILTHAQRPHTHDVKAMAVAHDGGGDSQEYLCSGGIDTKLCVYNTKRKEFAKDRPKIIYPWPSVSPITVAPHGRILALIRPASIDFFKLSQPVHDSSSSLVADQDAGEVLSTLNIKSSTNLICAAMDSGATFLAVSDALDGLLIFQLDINLHDKAVNSIPVPLPSSMRFPCVSVTFCGPSRLACATIHGKIVIVELGKDDSDKVVVENHHIVSTDDVVDQRMGLFSIHKLSASHDGQWLVACQNGLNQHGQIQVFSKNDDGSYQHFWTVPKLDVPFTTADFLLGEKAQLIVSCINYGFYIFDLKEKSLSKWSEKAGFPITPVLPQELASRNDYPVRFAFNKATPNKLLMVPY